MSLLVLLASAVEANPGRAPTPAAGIPLKGPYRYERGWYHKIELGDSLPVLANRFGVELKYLARVNGLSPDAFLKMGGYFYIPPHSGFYHRVVRGETIQAVARRYHLDPDYLAATNRIQRSTTLRPGEVLIVPTRTRPAPIPPQPTARARSATAGSAASPPPRASGAPAVSRPSRPPPAAARPSPSASSSGATRSSSLAGMSSLPTERLDIPGGGLGSAAPRPPAASGGGRSASSSSPPASNRNAAPPSSSRPASAAPSPAPSHRTSSPSGGVSQRRGSDGRPVLQWPVEGTITKRYVNDASKKHRGVDIAAPAGTPIRAAADGTVIYSGNDIPGYGNMVIVDHGRGWATCYAHNAENLVKTDQRVGAGQVIARVGQTGQATGPHCHFEVRYRYEAIDPMPLLP